MTKKYIDAESAKRVIKKVCETYNIAFENGHGGFGDMLAKAIDDMPAADVQEVRHGQWEDANETFECSICGYSFENEGYMHFFNFCPNCGARMDGEEK